MSKNESIRFIRERIKQMVKLRIPNYELPADSFIDECAEDIISFLFGMTEKPESSMPTEILNDRILSITHSLNKELYNKVGELSMKLNMMQSSLREFEKQKVEPLKDENRKIVTWQLTIEKQLDNMVRVIGEHSKNNVDKSLMGAHYIEFNKRLDDQFNLFDDHVKATQSTDEVIKGLLQQVDVLGKQVEFLKQEKSSMSNDLGSVMRAVKLLNNKFSVDIGGI